MDTLDSNLGCDLWTDPGGSVGHYYGGKIMQRRAMMLKDAHLIGTDLRLQEGQIVIVTTATNQPDWEAKRLYFVRPPWANNGAMLLVEGEDFEFKPR